MHGSTSGARRVRQPPERNHWAEETCTKKGAGGNGVDKSRRVEAEEWSKRGWKPRGQIRGSHRRRRSRRAFGHRWGRLIPKRFEALRTRKTAPRASKVVSGFLSFQNHHSAPVTHPSVVHNRGVQVVGNLVQPSLGSKSTRPSPNRQARGETRWVLSSEGRCANHARHSRIQDHAVCLCRNFRFSYQHCHNGPGLEISRQYTPSDEYLCGILCSLVLIFRHRVPRGHAALART